MRGLQGVLMMMNGWHAVVFPGDSGDFDGLVPEPPPLVNKVLPEMYDKSGVPEWYRRGADVAELIEAASVLDWVADAGGEVRPGSLKLPPPPPETESTTDEKQDSNHQQQTAQAPAPPPTSSNTPNTATANGMDSMMVTDHNHAVGMDNLTIAVREKRSWMPFIIDDRLPPIGLIRIIVICCCFAGYGR